MIGETDKAISEIERQLTTPFAVDYTDDSITLSDLRTRWEQTRFGAIRGFKKHSMVRSCHGVAARRRN